MKYFIPDWDDLVDPNYDFINDKHTEGRDPFLDDVYAHEIYGDRLSYDGILVSRAQLDKSKRKKDIANQVGIHRSLRIDKSIPVLGDSGAFDYIAKDEPTYKTDDLMRYYDSLGFDYGVSLDHLIIPEFYHQKHQRMNITINNAREMMELYKVGNYNFKPIGAVQGWDPSSYTECAKQLINMGYDYIALGGMVRSQTKDIIAVLKELKPILPKNINLHLFGIARLDSIKEFASLGVTSIDSASPLRQAWTDANKNYHVNLDKIDAYTAVRIPSYNGGEFAKAVKAEIINEELIYKLEQKCLNELRTFDKTLLNIDSTIDLVIEYSSLKNSLEYINNLKLFKNNFNTLIDLLSKDKNKKSKELDKLLKNYLNSLILPNFTVYNNKEWNNWLNSYTIPKIDKESEKILLDIAKSINTEIENLFSKLLKEKSKLFQISNYVEKDIPKLKNKLKILLQDKPWKECDCKICKDIGIEVVIFRGNNRNRRRGFHNTLRFYEKMKNILSKN